MLYYGINGFSYNRPLIGENKKDISFWGTSFFVWIILPWFGEEANRGR